MTTTNEQFKERVKHAVSYGYVEVDFYKHFEDYDEKDSGSLEGHREKEFLRIDSALFQDLIKELQTNPNCSYITYLNKIIKGYVPKKISCMVKRLDPDTKNAFKVDDPDLTFKEALASQILNIYECPTVYNLTIRDTEIKEDYAYNAISVDMVSDNILTFEDIGCEFIRDLEKNIIMIKRRLECCDLPPDLVEKHKNQIIEDYVYSYLIRRFILQDEDFYEYNGGILVEDNNLQYINFDFEYIFYWKSSWPNIAAYLTFVKNNYPKVYEKFKSITRELYNTLYELIRNEEIEWISSDHYYNVNTLMKNTRTMVMAFNHIDSIAVH